MQMLCTVGSFFFLFTAEGVASDKSVVWQDVIPDYKSAKVEIAKNGPTLIFSDSPELVNENGIMYRDTVSGNVRVFFHHVNNTKSEQRIAVVLKNVNEYPAKITFGRRGISSPELDYFKAGKQVQIEYLLEAKQELAVLTKQSLKEIITGTGIIVAPEELVTGMFEFTTFKPIEVITIMYPVDMKLEDAIAKYQVLPPDPGTVLRGTFKEANRIVTLKQPIDVDDGLVKGILLADDNEDRYARGIDATTGKQVVNYGNYGVVYDFRFDVVGKNNFNIRLNPWGGLFAGAGIILKEGKEHMRLFPEKDTAFGQTGREAIVIETAKAPFQGTLIFSPPGTSNLPVRIFFEPKEKSFLGKFKK
ncbi:MAG TPA: hypothetical protein H9887_08935 [Candidatus Dorea intestinavium]|nr:hypothetical protein [Candidatus Dorea intestinavium]